MSTKKIPFKVSARTARLIGRENVSNAEGAVIELVKNGHDADARGVHILFSDDSLFIVDNGHGMTEAVIQDIWMTIGTDNKEYDPFSPNKRVKSGAKGIGRFSLDRLGGRVDMYTLPEGSDTGSHWSVDWAKFEKRSAVVSDVKADLVDISKGDFQSELKLLKAKDPSFNVEEAKQGTILCIRKLRDAWSEEALDKLYQALESLVPIIENDSFSIRMFANDFPDKYGAVEPLINKDFDYRVVAKYDNERRVVTVNMIRNELDLHMLQTKYKPVFDMPLMKTFPYTWDVFEQGEYTREFPVEELIKGYMDSGKILPEIGDFTFDMTFAKNGAPNGEDLRKYPYRNAEYGIRTKWLRKFGGIKLYRDNFRVRPYGENGDDWLHLGERQAQSPAGAGHRLGDYRVRPNQIAGSVHISRISNNAFRDKSSREGIQDNSTFTLFKNLLEGIISIFEDDRNTIFYSLSELYKSINKDEQTKQEARRIADEVNSNPSKEANIDSAAASTLAKAITVLESESKEKTEEIKILRNLASSGLITAAAAHELRGFENRLITRHGDMRNLIEPYVKPSDLSEIDPAFNPYVLIDDMEKTDKSIYEWLNYALMPLRKDRRRMKTIYFYEYFDQCKENWKNLLGKRKITLEVKPIDQSYSVRAFPMDFDTIFNNLIINSVESFARQKNKVKREIQVKCSYKDSTYIIDYSDNGEGLDPGFAKNPDEIFLPQKTTKRDNAGTLIGTGMGMYLVKSVVDENKGSIKINPVTSGFAVTISFKDNRD